MFHCTPLTAVIPQAHSRTVIEKEDLAQYYREINDKNITEYSKIKSEDTHGLSNMKLHY